MSEINTELRFELLRKHAESCTPSELLDAHDYFYNKYSNGDCPNKSAVFGDCLIYSKKLVMKFKPEDGMTEMLGDLFDPSIYGKAEIEMNYTYFLSLIASIEEFYEDPIVAAYFAYKCLKMIDYFHPYLNDFSKAKLLEEGNYKIAYGIFERYKNEWEEYKSQYSIGDFETDLLFEWERKIYHPSSHANQNFQYRTFD